ncbi:hypothetical protein [Methylobacterium sp. BTF04]|uniref:hypothetical protein n=1 Tax=Methylobacterium sp. BTF04 TaxID=2708300 RepID=UPI001FED3A05|nr:hypothetical protein [Methylobacterium sp. BTF04]
MRTEPEAQDYAAASAALDDAPEAETWTEPTPRIVSEPVTLAESLMTRAGWSPSNFGDDGPNPPYLRIGGKLWVTLTEFEPCFSSFHRDRVLFRSKVSMADHLARYDQIMIDPLAFEECFGPEEGTEATFPFGTWLTIREVRFTGIALWGKSHGRVVLPLEPLAVASAVWLRNATGCNPVLL